MKRILALVLAVCAAAMLLCSCGSEPQSSSTASSGPAKTQDSSAPAGGSSGSSDGEEITLVWVDNGLLAGNRADQVIEKWYQIHPEIKIDYVELGSTADEEFMKNLDVMIAGGTTVDVNQLIIGDFYKRVQNGAVLPLDEYIAADNDDYDAMYGAGATAAVSYNGQIYGVPFKSNTFKVFYNKTMTDAANITIPDSWSLKEFREIAKQLNDPANNVYGCIVPSTWSEVCYSMASVAGWEPVVKDDNGAIRPNFDDERFREVMQWVRDLADVDGVTPSYATITAESINRRMALANGQTAMIVDGPYTLYWLETYMYNDPGDGALPFELGVTEIPYATDEAKSLSYGVTAQAYYVPKTSAHPKEAYEFCKFISNEAIAEIDNFMPAYLQHDPADAADSLLTFTDSEGVLHENVYPQEVVEKGISIPQEMHSSHWGFDPTLAGSKTIATLVLDDQWSLFMTGEIDMDEWIDLLQELAAEELKNAA